MEDIGTLEVSPTGLIFRGKQSVKHFPPPVTVRYGLQGADRRVPWAELRFADGTSALVADGRWLGWVGAFGGTRRLSMHLQNVFGVTDMPSAEVPDDAHWRERPISNVLVILAGMALTTGLLASQPFVGLGVAVVLCVIAFAFMRKRASTALEAARRRAKNQPS